MIQKMLFSFLFGGLVCAVAQLLIDKTNITPAKILVSYVGIGVILGAFEIYNPILKVVGTGISLPIIGFGGAIANGVRESILSIGFLGIFRGPFEAMGTGVCLAILTAFSASLLTKGKSKKM